VTIYLFLVCETLILKPFELGMVSELFRLWTTGPAGIRLSFRRSYVLNCTFFSDGALDGFSFSLALLNDDVESYENSLVLSDIDRSDILLFDLFDTCCYYIGFSMLFLSNSYYSFLFSLADCQTFSSFTVFWRRFINF